MADIPTVSDIKTTLILAQRVELLIDDTRSGDTDSDADDRLTTMTGLRVPVVHPKKRNNMGTDRFYSFARPDIDIGFTLNVTEDVMDFVETRGQLNSNFILTEYEWVMRATSNDGTVKTVQLTGVLDRHEYVKNEEDQENPWTVVCNVTVTDDNYSIS